MKLQKLVLKNFRSYENREFSFSSGLNCIEGENGTGKSNLLEAIYLFSTGRSFKAPRLTPLIRHGCDTFCVKGVFAKDEIEQEMTLTFGPEGRELLIGGKSYRSFLPVLGKVPFVLLSPEDISIINEGPSERRRFIDIHLAQVDPLYLTQLGRYQKALKGRNLQLKYKQVKGMFVWEEIMAESACYLVQKRASLIDTLSPISREVAYFLSEKKEPFTISYENNATACTKEKFQALWESSRAQELLAGTTLKGPHRDDIHFYIQEKPLKTYGSEGQKRCCLASLRLAEWKHLHTLFSTAPLFGIDDFGVHLDANRAVRLQQALENMGQVFLTAPSFTNKTRGHFLFTQASEILAK